MLNAFRSSTSTYSTLRLLQWLWNILRHHRLQTGLNTLLGCSTVLLDFMFIAATKWTIDIATYKAPGSLSIAAALLIGILLSQLCIHFASRWIKAILGVKAQNHMQRFYFDRLLHSEWKDRNRRHSGDLLNRLERDVTDVVNAVTETAPSIIAVCIRLVGAFLFLYSMDASLACLTIAIIPLFMVLSKVYMKRMRKLTREIRNTDSRIQSILQETIQHQMVVQTLEQQSVMVQRLDNIQQDLRNQIKTRTRFSSISSSFLSAGFMGCYLVAFLWGSRPTARGDNHLRHDDSLYPTRRTNTRPVPRHEPFHSYFRQRFYSRRTSHAIRRDSFGKTSRRNPDRLALRHTLPSSLIRIRQGKPPHAARFHLRFPAGQPYGRDRGNRCRENDFNTPDAFLNPSHSGKNHIIRQPWQAIRMPCRYPLQLHLRPPRKYPL